MTMLQFINTESMHARNYMLAVSLQPLLLILLIKITFKIIQKSGMRR